ncbi:DNA-binding response regulator, araC family [Vibrio ishigakensis]|uniref:DNA-binding response regulator, araC family n=1 Tax=Vibrio ishigakensis TaxID=1481914 RepID=A0A0B8NJS7_9VIBR|nr:AraC family transcriptional regulator [Vibrio ishigakensis]GAM54376.1 DNA-binding response regulator, araC family [Vibrio ishigakensis]
MNARYICIGLGLDSVTHNKCSNIDDDFDFDFHGRDISVLTRPEIKYAIFILGEEVDELFEIACSICSNLGKRLIVLTAESYVCNTYTDKVQCTFLNYTDLSKLRGSLSNLVNTTTQSTNISGNLPSKRLNKIDMFIEKNIDREIREEEVANLANFSTTYFSKFFRKHKNISFQEYLSNKRVELSKQLLTSQPREKVSSIAFQVGYSDVSYFNRVFKKHTSLTPTEYRQNVVR